MGVSVKHIIRHRWDVARRVKDAFDSNVHRLNLSMKHKDAQDNPQIFMYSAGLGTSGTTSKYSAGIFAEGIDESILQAYINLCSNYEPGDKIYLFGFSRGAVAVRALCSFIRHSRLLKSSSSFMIREAWHHFIRTVNDPNYNARFEPHTHQNVEIEFLGVWDTVYGPVLKAQMFRRFRFEDLVPERNVRHAVQILAIDDRRWSFAPVLWTQEEPKNDAPERTVEQIWMPGVHSDVGGGSDASFLSTLSLLLMIDKLAQWCPEVAFEEDYIRKQLIGRLELEDTKIVVNYERHRMSPYSWVDRPRKIGGDHTFHREHPITKHLRDRQIEVRKGIDYYMPGYRIDAGAPQLEEISFEETSWYKREVVPIVEKKVRRLQSRPRPGGEL